jgi:copper chaperone
MELRVTGMTCDHCVHAVTEALESVPGVKRAVVNLDAGSAKVEHEDADVDAMVAAVEEEGYEAVPA